jgi:VCBS repeat-containing protein
VNANASDRALSLGGTNAYVTFGAAPGLGAATFTLETWFRRDGTGIATNTGNGGVVAVPLVTKGMAETEGGNVDMNYFLGIRPTDNVLVADFEDAATGLNHPVAGTTAIPADGVWRHVAATYDGTTWRVFLNGVLEVQLVVGNFTPQFNSIQHAALGTALNSTGAVTSGQTAGFFNGAMDEVRIWNYARSSQQIGRGRQFEIAAAPGLLGRWGMNAISGTSVADSSGNGRTGTIVGTNFAWVTPGAPFSGPANSAPVAANDTATTTRNTAVTIAVLANDVDADGDALTVTIGSAPVHGTAAVNANGSVLYTPAAGYEGGDAFTYVINDNQGGGTSAASVAITVAGIGNVAPVVSAGPDQAIALPATTATLAGTASDDGVPGALTTVWSKVSGPGTVTFANAAALSTTATFSVTGTYVLQLTANDGALSSSDTVSVVVNANPTNKGLDLGGTNAYMTFGAAPGLGVSTLTIETWFRRDGAGIATNTGTGGVVAVPLVTKGMAEAEGGSVDMNYFLGIRSADGVLVADFEDNATGANHPVAGTTAIPADGAWRHVAATYDGTTWRLYLNGALEAQLLVGNFTPQAASVQHAALGTALNSTGGVGTQTQGFFDGVMDEARVWNHARTASQIARGSQLEIVTAPGLRGRWGMNEGSGTTVADSSGNNIGGTLVGTNVAWAAGAPFTGSNAAPVAVNDTAAATEGGTVTITLLANDTDADGDALAVTAVTLSGAAGQGSASLNTNGTATYTPAANFNGTDTFTYAISDGQGGVSTGSVSVTVAGINDAPVAVNDTYSTDKNTTLVVPVPGVLANDTDPDGDALTAFVLIGTLHGDLTLSADGDFIYTPETNFKGTDTFTYVADDAETSSNVATVTITVVGTNVAPVAVDDTASATEDTPLAMAAPAVLGNDSDADGDALTAVLVSGPAHGTVTVAPDGGFIYTPAANYNGPDSFSYKANDGKADSNVATVSITVAAANDAPTAAPDAFATNEDIALSVTAPGLLANDTDVDGDALTTAVVAGPSHGTVTVNANGSFTYTPAANYSGSDSFTYEARDGSSASAPATVTIAVASMPDPPVAENDAYATNEDTALVVFGPGVLGNDTDIDGHPLTAALVTGPAHGSVTLNAGGGFTYIPAANYAGADSFTYQANDLEGSSNVATVAIMVNPVNDAPVAAANGYSTSEDIALVVAVPGVLGNDADADNNPLQAILASGPANGTLALDADGEFTYTPNANFAGVDSFTYRASDGVATSNVVTVSLTVNAVNDVPVANGDSYTATEDTPLVVSGPGLVANDSDVEGAALTAVKVTNPTRGTVTVNANGSFTYTPNANANGVDSFTYRVSDGTANSAPATVTITVNAVNDAPVANNQARSLAEDATRAIVLTGSDVDANPLTFTIVTAPAHGVLVGVAPNVTYDPDPNYNGPDSFTFRVNDGLVNSAVGTVTLTVTAVNDTPVGQAATYSTPKNTALSRTLVATDVDGNTLTYSISTLPTRGTVTINAATGAFVYTPNPGTTGADFFRFRASDGIVSSTAVRIDITVQP